MALEDAFEEILADPELDPESQLEILDQVVEELQERAE